MKYALIGCGSIAPNHIEAALSQGLTVAALCDAVPENMEKLAQRFSLPDSVSRYTDHRKLLEAEQPELTAVAVTSGAHASAALDCIRAGSHVMIEKPIALSLADADRIIMLAKEKNVLVSVCHQYRFHSAVQYIRRALDAGRFGRLLHGTVHVRWNRGEGYFAQAPWRGTRAQDGGMLMNQCIHSIDLLRWMMGNEIDEVSAYTANRMHPSVETEDLGLALVKFSSGAYGIIEGTVNVYPKNLESVLNLFGENGTVRAGGSCVNTIEEWRFADGLDDPEAVKAAFHEGAAGGNRSRHIPLYADMVGAVRTGRQPLVTGEDGRRALELVLAIYKSAYEGRPVKLPLTDCSVLDFRGRFGR